MTDSAEVRRAVGDGDDVRVRDGVCEERERVCDGDGDAVGDGDVTSGDGLGDTRGETAGGMTRLGTRAA